MNLENLSLTKLEQAVTIARRIQSDKAKLSKVLSNGKGNGRGGARKQSKMSSTRRVARTVTAATPTRTRRAGSPQEQARRRTAGKYMAAMRTLTLAEKREIKSIKADKGVRAAIAQAREFAAAKTAVQ